MKAEAYHLGLIGWPLQHSLSPALHQAALDLLGLEGDYCCFPIEPLPKGGRSLGVLLDKMRAGQLQGINVTSPHKESILAELDRLAPTAERIGAVNTIFLEGRALIGDNTDRDGFLADLDAMLAPRVGHALVLGAGGAARAVVDGLSGRGWRVWVAARRLDQAQGLARSLFAAERPAILPIKLEAQALARVMAKVDLIVNATPLGMMPELDASPWPAEIPLPDQAFIYDLVYMPQEAQLIRAARRAGLRAASGLGMLVEQAALSFERWTKLSAPREGMRLAAEQAAQAGEERKG